MIGLDAPPRQPRTARPGLDGPPAAAAGHDWRDAGPLCLDDAEGIGRLRCVLEACGYSSPSMYQRLGLEDGRQPGRPDLPLYRYRLRADEPIDLLIKVLYLGDALSPAEADRAFAPDGWRRFRDLGLLEESDGGVTATCAISSYAHLRLAHDRLDPRTLAERGDYVLGMNPPAQLLAAMTPRRRVARTLDVGTGSGIQAFLAAASSDRVVATDLCPRALHYATFGARLNRIENVEFRSGSLFDPVAGERFDLVVANPPYVISPDRAFAYRDSGLPGDTLCARLLREVGAHLTDQGRAVTLLNWAHRVGVAGAADEHWDAPVRRWLTGSGCDAWIIRHETNDPLTYAANWTRQRDAGKYAADLARWVAHFELEGIRAISLGAVFVRRRVPGPNWIRSEEAPRGGVSAFGDQVERLFTAVDFVAAHPAQEDLMATVLQPAADHEVVRSLVPRAPGYEVGRTQLRTTGGFRFEGSLDETSVRLLTLLDGRRTLGEVVQALVSRGGLEPKACAEIAANLARRLVVLGFLVPVQGAACGGFPSPGGDAGAPSAA